MSELIEFRNIGICFGSNIVHRDVSFAVKEGETLTILGPSGTGKTLLFKMLIGLLRPTSGQIHLRGKRIDNLTEEEFLGVRKDIGILFQGAALFDSLNVFENIAYPLREGGMKDRSKIREVVDECLSFVDLSTFDKHFPHELSGGQKKRIGLARALAVKPSIILFDEPTTGLDPTSTRMIEDLIIRLSKEQGLSSLVITHDIQSARRISQRWMLLSDGTVQAIGPVQDLEGNNSLVKSFIEGHWQS